MFQLGLLVLRIDFNQPLGRAPSLAFERQCWCVCVSCGQDCRRKIMFLASGAPVELATRYICCEW